MKSSLRRLNAAERRARARKEWWAADDSEYVRPDGVSVPISQHPAYQACSSLFHSLVPRDADIPDLWMANDVRWFVLCVVGQIGMPCCAKARIELFDRNRPDGNMRWAACSTCDDIA